jgi:hypothetical protein
MWDAEAMTVLRGWLRLLYVEDGDAESCKMGRGDGLQIERERELGNLSI